MVESIMPLQVFQYSLLRKRKNKPTLGIRHKLKTADNTRPINKKRKNCG